MRRLALILCLLLTLGSAVWLRNHPVPKNRVDLGRGGVSLPLLLTVDILGLHELAVGWLWLKFDLDSLGVSKNYHRLLAWLDLITILKPDEYHAWGLKTYMRLLRPENADAPLKQEQLMKELIAATEHDESNYRGYYEVAYLYAFYFKKPDLAMPYATLAARLNPNRETLSVVDYLKRELEKQGKTALPDFPAEAPTLDLPGVLNPSDIRPLGEKETND